MKTSVSFSAFGRSICPSLAALALAFLAAPEVHATLPITVTASTTTPTLGQPVTFTATASSIYSGSVLFLDGATPLGYGTFSGLIPNTATFTTSLLPAGVRLIRARNQATSQPLTVTVTPVPESILKLQPAITGFASSNSLAVADLNGDGYPDLITSNDPDGDSTSVAVSLGSASGSFSAPIFYPVAGFPGAIAVADLNHDGHPDVIVASTGYTTFYVFLGNGDGTLQAPSAVQIGGESGIQQLAVGDFNNDGSIDVAVSCPSGIGILLGNGDGTFGTTAFTLGVDSYSGSYLVVADFNNDGLADIAVQDNSESSETQIFLGAGGGTFTFGPLLPPGLDSIGPIGLVAADLNGDGKVDLVLGDTHQSIVYIGKGDGTFTSGNTLDKLAASLALGDFNGDGKPDLVFSDANDTNISVWTGDGTGAFGAAFGGDLASTSGIYRLVVADFNGDGRSDIAGTTLGTTDQIYFGGVAGLHMAIVDSGSFFQGETGATYTLTVSNNAGVGSTGTTTVTDLLPSGFTATAISGLGWDCYLATLACTRTDSLTANSSFPAITLTFNIAMDAPASVTNTASVTGTISNASSSDSASDISAVTVLLAQNITFQPIADVTYGNGPITLAATASSGLTVFYSVTGNCTVSGATLTITGAGSCVITASQPGGNGYFPATPVMQTLNILPASATITIGNLTQTFTGTPSPLTTVTNPSGLSVALTYNGGPTEPTAVGTYTVIATVTDPNYTGSTTAILVISPVGSLLLSSSTPTVTLGNPVTLTATATPSTLTGKVLFLDEQIPIGVAPLVNGIAALTTTQLPANLQHITANYLGLAPPLTTVTVNPAPDNGLISQPVTGGFTETYMTVIADVNNDGYPDLITLDDVQDQVGVQLGSMNGTFSPPVFYQVDDGSATYSVYQVGTADFNGDGNLDIAVLNDHGGLSIFLGNGDGTFQNEVTTSVPSNGYNYSFAVGDFNRDGIVDIMITGNRNYIVLLGTGAGGFTQLPAVTQSYFTGYSNASDLNGDGLPDLILQENNSGVIHVLQGNGDGTFANDITVGSNVDSSLGVTVFDFNRDGIPDMLTASNDVVLVFPGTGGGYFTDPITIYNESPYAVSAGDFNGDGNPDIVVANGNNYSVDVFFGDGVGTFTLGLSGPTPPDDVDTFLPYALAVADFNGDGQSDVAVPGYDANVVLYYGTPLSGLQVALPTNLSLTQGQNGASFDAIVTNNGVNPSTGTVSVLFTIPNGLTATAIAGTGWTCTLGAFTCTRTDALAKSVSFPVITVTFNVAADAAASLIASAEVTGKVTGFPNDQTANTTLAINTQTVLLPQTITLLPLPPHVYGDPFFILNATATSGLPVIYTASGNCVVIGAGVTMTGAGSCTITANQSGDTTYSPAPQVSQTFTIAKAIAPVGISNLAQKYTGIPSPVTTFTLPVGLTVTVSYNGSPVVPTAAGSYPVVATISDPNYQGSATGTLVISQSALAQTISFAAPMNVTYGAAPFILTATSTSGLPVSFTASGTCALTGSTVTVSGAGSCVLTAVQNGNATYAPAIPVSQTILIAKAPATIVLGNLIQAFTGLPSPVTSVTTPAGLNVSLTYNGSTTVPTASGTYSVVAAVSSSNYIGSTTGTLVIAQSQTISFASPGAHTYGDAPFTLTATASSGLPVTFSASGACAITGSTVTITAAGSCALTANQPGNTTYSPAAPVSQTITIGKATALVLLTGLSQTFTGNPLSVSAVTIPSGLPLTFTYKGQNTPPSAVGTYPVVATVNSANYLGGSMANFVILEPGLQLTWLPASPVPLGTALGDADLNAVANVAGAFAYTPAAGTQLDSGVQTLSATFTPTGSLLPVTIQAQILVGPGAQTLVFQPIGPHSTTDAPFNLVATASSGLPVTFTVISGPATVSGATLTLTGAGTVVVQASVAGSGTFLPTTASQSFTVGVANGPSIGAVVNAASFAQGTVTPGYLATLFGTNLATGAVPATTNPLPTTLSGSTVTLTDGAGKTLTAELLFVSPGQVNFLVPASAQAGSGTLTVAQGALTATYSLQIGATHPGLFAANSQGTGAATGNALHLAADGSETYSEISNCSGSPLVCSSLPIAFTSDSDRIFLVLYGTGIRNVTSASTVTVIIAGQSLPVLYAGPQNQYEGLDQINVELPRSMASAGQVPVQVTIDGQSANPVSIIVQ